MGMEKELVYLFLYNPMVHTNGWTTQSIHKTRKSAIKAMEEHKAIALVKWEQDFHTPEERKEHPFGVYEDWRVNAMVLEP
jgi:methionine aminopeptidase